MVLTAAVLHFCVRRVRVLAFTLITFATMIGSTGKAWAHHVTFAGSQTVIGAGLNDPTGIAVDSEGNVYIADSGNNRVLKVPPSDPTCATAGDCTEIGSGLVGPFGVAVDSLGNVYIADSGNNRILKVPASDPTCSNAGDCTVLGGSILDFPFGLAADETGNVYVAEPFVGVVLKIPASDPTCANPSDCTPLGGSAVVGPFAVALDGQGNLYVANGYYGTVVQLPVSDPTCSTPSDCGSFGGLTAALGVAADTAGDVYISDAGINIVLTIPASGPCPGFGCTLVGAGLNTPIGVAVDAQGDNVYIANSGGNDALRVQIGTVNFGSANVCGNGETTPAPCSQTLTLYYNVTAGTNIGSIKFLTNGVSSLDFKAEAHDSSSTLCSPQTYQSATQCTVDVTFAPTAAGARTGEVEIVEGNGNVLSTVQLNGTGIGVGAQPVAQISTTTVDFPNLAFGSTETKYLTVKNVGGGTLTLTSLIDGPSYKILTTPANTCLAGVSAGQSCELPIEFDPVSVGDHHDTLTVTASTGAVTKVKLDGMATE